MSRELRLRIASGLVLGALVLGTLVLGGKPFAFVWYIAGAFFAMEWLAMIRTPPANILPGIVAVLVYGLADTVHDGDGALPLVVLCVLGFLVVVALTRNLRSVLSVAAAVLAGFVIAVVPPLLRDDPAIGIVGPAWMFAVVWSTDIAAYFAGRRFGGPKLMPKVSPKKTWSGALGGLAAATIAGLVTVLVARGEGWAGMPALSLWLVAVASALASIVSQAGDLLESALKRRYGVKDSGDTIPGHGGVMDRLDGFFTVAVLVGLALALRALTSA